MSDKSRPPTTRKFAHYKKGNSVQEKIKKSKRNEKSSMLRKYAKLCKREGIESGRINMSGVPRDVRDTAAIATDVGYDAAGPKRREKKASKHGNGKDPFTVAALATATKKAERDAKEADITRAENEQKAARALRARKTKEMNRRTKKGQPVMKYRLNNILEKLLTEHKAAPTPTL